jgi:hypothetical protein
LLFGNFIGLGKLTYTKTPLKAISAPKALMKRMKSELANTNSLKWIIKK